MTQLFPTSRLAVFDCDGTLVDGQGAVCTAMEQAFAVSDFTCPPRAVVRRILGLSLPQAIGRLAPDAPAEAVRQMTADFKSAFRAAREAGILSEPLYDGIPDLLAALRGAGWAMGVATGKSDAGLSHCLAVHGISDYFVTLQTADRHPSKPNPAMLEAALAEAAAERAQAVMIGDTVYDIAMAAGIGVRAVGVAWGYHEPAELLGAGAVHVAQTVRELQEFLLDG